MEFEKFLQTFIPKVAEKSKQANKAAWILETTGSSDAADLKAALEGELRLMFNDRPTYEKLLNYKTDDPILKRQLNVLIRTFKHNMIPKSLLEQIVQKEAQLAQSYANFRPTYQGKPISENEIRNQLKTETNPSKRQKVWEASKEIGDVLAPQILELVKLRNEAAKAVGYSDYFQMELDLQEVDGAWLKKTLEDLASRSDAAYLQMLEEIENEQQKRFGAKGAPWFWNEPYCQEDPLDHTLDELVDGVDLSAAGKAFYHRMGIDVGPILERSDMYERSGKNQHAFCVNIDRENDVRTLNNVQSSIKWLETVLHELGHAIYELGFDSKLPWLLREPPHILTTEAMALIAGRQAYRYEALKNLVGPKKEALLRISDASLKRRQLIFSRWVVVMTIFEQEMYRNPSQNLNQLWWKCVEKFQKITPPKGRDHKNDWAAKYHIGLAPVYYFSYLLGELFASGIEEALFQKTGSRNLDTPGAGQFIQQKLFHPGNRYCWTDLITHVQGHPLTADAWLKQFAS